MQLKPRERLFWHFLLKYAVNKLYFRKPGQGKTFPKGWLHIECFLIFKPVITRGKISLSRLPVTKAQLVPGPENLFGKYMKCEGKVCCPQTAFETKYLSNDL